MLHANSVEGGKGENEIVRHLDTLLNDKGKVVPDLLKPFFTDAEKWKTTDFSSFSLSELDALPEIALANTLDRSISIKELKGNLLHA